MKQPYNTALYMRLSRDDENYGDSVSIETQRTILRQFAKENQLHVMDEYIDDGWSGTNFERPNFKRMMDDVELGKINCIVTKDLSRFGREHVMMDYYLEFVFPEKKIRYIAVSDNEDTEKGLSDFVPFKNLFKNTPPSGRVNSHIHPIAPTNRYTTVTSCRTCPSMRIFSPTTIRSTSSSSIARSTSSTAVYFRTVDTHF